MKVKYKKEIIIIHLAVLPNGEEVRIIGETTGLKEGQEIEGEYIERTEQIRYENGEYARGHLEIKEFNLTQFLTTKRKEKQEQ